MLTTYIEVRNASAQPVAFLTPEADGIKGCYPDAELNGASSLEFQLPLTSDKWQYITDSCRIIADGKEYVILKSGAVDTTREGQKLWGKVMAKESWILLDKHYVSLANDGTIPSWSQVIILSGGTAVGGYAAGSAGSALTQLLVGSGWSLGTCDVIGTFDLETEKESVLGNIQKVQELWGGLLIWDSINKTLSLRDETLWQNYTGFQIRYAKNLKGITKTTDNDLVTRLYPFGMDGLNIGSVNGGVIYLDNFSHSSGIYEGILENQNITDAQELKDWAIAQHTKLAVPRNNYQVKMVDLRTLPGYTHETFALGDMADVIDIDCDNINDRCRIIHYKYDFFHPWNVDTMELGDPIKKLAATISNASKAADFVNSIKPNASFQNLLKAIIDSAATEINGASGDYTLTDGVSTWWGTLSPQTGQRKVTRISPGGIVISNDGGVSWDVAIDGDGIYADKVIVNDVYALSSGDSYTKMGGSGVVVVDTENIVRAHLGQYATGKFGLKVTNGDIVIDSSSGKSRIILNPDDALKIQKLVGSVWTDVLSEDIDGDLIMSGKIIRGSGSSIFKADDNGIYLGNGTFANAPFSVSLAGALKATNANIKGTIDCDDLKIDGTSILTDQKISTTYIESLEVGTNVTMGTGAIITWDNLNAESKANLKGADGYTPVKGTDYFDGVAGQNGATGAAGTSSYLWVRYSQNSDGSSMTTSPTGAKYIGIATTTVASAPASNTSYSWSLIKGTDGVAGEVGANGQTSYLHIKYSDNGTSFTANSGETVGAWIGTYVDFTQADSTTFSAYMWNKVKGDPGIQGAQGSQGPQGVQGIQGPAGDDAQLPTWITDWGGQTVITGGWIATPKMFIGSSTSSIVSGIRIESAGIMSYYNNALSGCSLGNDGTLQLWNTGTQVGEFRYDTNGAGTAEEAANRMFLSSKGTTALKIQTANANMSIEAKGTDKKIFIAGAIDFGGAIVTGLHAQWA